MNGFLFSSHAPRWLWVFHFWWSSQFRFIFMPGKTSSYHFITVLCRRELTCLKQTLEYRKLLRFRSLVYIVFFTANTWAFRFWYSEQHEQGFISPNHLTKLHVCYHSNQNTHQKKLKNPRFYIYCPLLRNVVQCIFAKISSVFGSWRYSRVQQNSRAGPIIFRII